MTINIAAFYDALDVLLPEGGWSVAWTEEFEVRNLEFDDHVQTPPTLEQILAQAEIEAPKIPWKRLRRDRDRLLTESDWMVSSDRTATAEQLAYRQALRDLPANTTDPENPVWPTKP